MPTEVNVFALFNALNQGAKSVKLSDCAVDKVGTGIDAKPATANEETNNEK